MMKPAIAILLGLFSLGTPTDTWAESSIDFNRDIRPILAANCFACHGPDDGAREAGVRLDRQADSRAELRPGVRIIVPGHSDDSELYKRVTHSDDGERMPPPSHGDRLKDHQIAVLKQWIDQGAVWAKHWSYVPPTRPPLPKLADATWPRNEIDCFVLDRMKKAGFDPSPQADRYTLIRRLSLDLTGLPPTVDQVDAFIADTHPDPYGRLVDRLLASPAYGERWAAVWLDLARYADSQGYAQDEPRSIWPYRDWVIRAYNQNIPFDQFTIDQIAGDLLPDPTRDQLVATGFHRNTMTNSEGGTDDEEFRVAAIVDRVNTTMEVWMGTTMGCGQCHSHKYDPVTQAEYYRFFAFFNNSEDSDRPDEAPTIQTPSKNLLDRIELAKNQLDGVSKKIDQALADVAYIDPGDVDVDRKALDHGWVDDEIPQGAEPVITGDKPSWEWISAPNGPVYTGSKSVRGAGSGVHQYYFHKAEDPLPVLNGDELFVHVYLDQNNPPRTLAIQLNDGNWEHRAYWGDDLIPWGKPDTVSRKHLGPLPPSGQWVKLTIPPSDVGLSPGAAINGWSFVQFDGTVWWDRAGVTRNPDALRYHVSQRAWERLGPTPEVPQLPKDVAEILKLEPHNRNVDQRTKLQMYYLKWIHAPTRTTIAPLNKQLASTQERIKNLRDAIPTTPVMRELPPEKHRTTNIMIRGNFLAKGDLVTQGVPVAFHPLPEKAPLNRLGLARWLVDKNNPLTARVVVNRYWERLFGTGLIPTSEDFGTQGELPSHPKLLDWLATEFMRQDWDVKALLRTITMSATYRQTAGVTHNLLEKDPFNRLLTRGPRFRLEGELIRDQALKIAGLLSGNMFGPSVKPPQPISNQRAAFGGSTDWKPSPGDDKYRRGLYTFWRRTTPYPSLMTFDAPSREFCTIRRIRTNTPLQALVTLNDPVFVEAAQSLARLMLTDGGPTIASRAEFAFRRCLSRPPKQQELDRIIRLFAQSLEQYSQDRPEAEKLATDPIGPPPDGIDVTELAAWTVVANVLLNLDETLTKR